MDLWKTTILPTDDVALAQRMLRDLVFEEPLVLLMVLGAGEEATTFAERASKNAGAKEEPWWVVWVRQPEQVRDVLNGLGGAQKLPSDITLWRGCTVSLANRIVDVFPREEPVPDQLEILTAFMRAAAG